MKAISPHEANNAARFLHLRSTFFILFTLLPAINLQQTSAAHRCTDEHGKEEYD